MIFENDIKNIYYLHIYIFLTEESQDPKTTTCERDVQNQNHPKKSYSFTILNYTYPH